MRRSPLLASLLLFITAVLGVFVDSAQRVDEARAHVICPLDGEIVHESAQHAPDEGPAMSQGHPARGPSIRADRTQHERECAFAHAGVVPAPLPAPAAPIPAPLPPAEATLVSAPAFADVARAVLTFAPKTSPPTLS